MFAVFAAFMLASALPKRALAAVLVVAVPRFLFAGVAELTGSQALSQAGAVLGFLLAGVALYTAFALLMEDSRGHEVLPIGRPPWPGKPPTAAWPCSCATSSTRPASAGRYDSAASRQRRTGSGADELSSTGAIEPGRRIPTG